MEFAMDIDFVVTWTAPVPGREKNGLEFVVELEQYWDNHAAQGHCTPPDVFLLGNGPGTFTVTGERRVLKDLATSEKLNDLLAKGSALFEDWHYRFTETGSRFETITSGGDSVAPA
jgi:hypothetical protein